jgi:hypothetical protein
MKATFTLGTTTASGEVVRVNDATVIIKMPNGKQIKRHIEKHKVEFANA